MFIPPTCVITNAAQTTKPVTPSRTYNVSKHMTYSESVKRKNELKLTQCIFLVSNHVRTKATQVTKQNIEAPF